MDIMNTTSFSQQFVDTINSYGLLQDRLAGDSLVLPSKWEDIKLKVNDFVLSETINYSFEQLHKNWLYLLSYSVIPTNDIPTTKYINYAIFDDGTGTGWRSQDQWVNSSINSELSGMNNILKFPNSVNNQNFNLIISTKNQLMLLSGAEVYNEVNVGDNFNTPVPIIINPEAVDSQGNIIRSKSSVTHPSNEILFENISDIMITDDLDLFVLDTFDGTIGHNILFKFDISGITTLDEAILKNDTPGRLLTRTVGGRGVITDKIKFENPISLLSVENRLFVLDVSSNNHCIVKEFDSHLNWKQSYDLGIINTGGYISDINYNSKFDSFYILTHKPGEIPHLYIYTSDFVFIETSNLMNVEKHGTELLHEVYKNIIFSFENNNIMYITTNKGVYKKYVSRPGSFIGDFLFDLKSLGPSESTRNNIDLTIQPIIIDDPDLGKIVKDEVFLIEDISNCIFRYVEDSGFETSLESDIESKFLTFENIMIKSDENVDVIVYNKALFKLIYNNLIIMENTSRKFSTYFDSKGFSRYRGFQYLNEDELSELRYILNTDNYISNNEVILTVTVNRCLHKIYELQQTIMNNMQEKSINVYPDPNVPIDLS